MFDASKFDSLLATWLTGAQKIIADYWTRMGYDKNMPTPTLEISSGAKYVKVWKVERGQRTSIHAFIDRHTGDVLKPASTKAPAKHARGVCKEAWFGAKI